MKKWFNHPFLIGILFTLIVGGGVWLYQFPHLLRDQPTSPENRTTISTLEILKQTPQPSLDLRKKESTDSSALDRSLRNRIRNFDAKKLVFPREFDEDRLRLGRWLFWEKELSGTRQVACAVCHHPSAATTDGLSLAIGPEGVGDTVNRRPAKPQDFNPRNAMSLFNMGQPEVQSFFWDGRIHRTNGTLRTPAGDKLPEDLHDPLEAQPLFPIVTNDEFQGTPGSKDIYGLDNRIANLPDTAFQSAWSRIMKRLLRHKEYRRHFVKAFPIDTADQASIEHVGKAIATYIETAYTLPDSRWNRYLMGYNGALSERQKKGAMLFFGKANCSSCHAGRLLSDQQPHNIGVPQLGPGKPPHEPYDLGAYAVTGNPEDKFAFKTPSLHNVAITGPWMHNGAYKSLEGAVRHHLNPEESLRKYNKQQLGRDIQKYHRSPNWEHQLEQFPMGPPGTQLIPTVKDDPESIERVLGTLDPQVKDIPELTDREVDQLMYFLFSLTSPSLVMEEYENQNGKDQILTQESRLKAMRMTPYMRATIPEKTPSGIPAGCFDEWCQ